MTKLDLPELPEIPAGEYEITGTLKRPEGSEPPAPGLHAALVKAVHHTTHTEWSLTVRAGSASMALTAAEMILPEATGATWLVAPVKSSPGTAAQLHAVQKRLSAGGDGRMAIQPHGRDVAGLP